LFLDETTCVCYGIASMFGIAGWISGFSTEYQVQLESIGFHQCHRWRHTI